jgi:hypothetical protein
MRSARRIRQGTMAVWISKRRAKGDGVAGERLLSNDTLYLTRSSEQHVANRRQVYLANANWIADNWEGRSSATQLAAAPPAVHPPYAFQPQNCLCVVQHWSCLVWPHGC